MSTRTRPPIQATPAQPELEVANVSRFHRSLIRLALATAFLSGLDVITNFGPLQVTHLILAVMFILTLLANRKMFPRGIVLLFFVLMILSYASVLVTQPTFGHGADRLLASGVRIVLAVFMLAAYYSAYVLAGRSIQAFFREYLKVALFFAVVGIVQELIFLVTHIDIFGFFPTGAKDFGSFLGISAVSVEPAFYACALLPAGAYYVVRFVTMLQISRAGIITVAAILLSTSSIGYIGLVAAAVIAVLTGVRLRRLWVLTLILPVLALAVYWMLQQEFVQLRLQDTLTLIEIGATPSTGANISSYALAVNSAIAFQSFSDNLGFGAGFGLYNVVFEQYVVGYEVPSYRASLPGSGSGTSFFLRMLAELGIFGLAIMGGTVLCFVKAIRAGVNRTIAIACLAAFSIILLRMGEYFDNGVLFVVLMAFLLRREAVANSRAVAGRLVPTSGTALRG